MIDFNPVSKHYDLLNHLLSLGVDYYWRYCMVSRMLFGPKKKILDMAAGTLDVSIALAKKFTESEIIAGDISEQMLEMGKKKISIKHKHQIKTQIIDAQEIPYEDNSFDAVTIAFGIRNVFDRHKALSEMNRVLTSGGQLCVLEFSPITKPKFLAKAFEFYLEKIMPKIAKLISGEEESYVYLAKSIKEFPAPKDFCEEIRNAGFDFVLHKKLTFGAANLYIANKS